jgi:hypothetical protein
MQWAKLTTAWSWARVECPAAAVVVLDVLELPEDPHPLSAIAAPTAPTAASQFDRGNTLIAAYWYAVVDNSAVTALRGCYPPRRSG